MSALVRPAAVVLLAALSVLGCQPSSPPGPAVQPVLGAVLQAGNPPTFAKLTRSSSGYEVLPSPAAILRLTNAYPGGADRIRVSITPRNGAAQTLTWVARDDQPGKQRLDPTGYYEIAVDNRGYSVIVTPPPAERTGTGYSISVVNLSPGGTPPESPPLVVGIEPRSVTPLASSVFFDCGNDYDAADGRWHYNCKPSASIVQRSFTLQGWLGTPGPNCLGTLCIEDFHYVFFPDPDFIEEYYGRGGVFAAILGSSQLLENLILPGNPPATTPPITIADRKPTGESRGITINSFLLAGNQDDSRPVGIVKAELNAWHIANQGSFWQRHWVGRGAPPAGWITPTVDANDPNFAAWLNTAWPYDPRSPNGVTQVVPGAYIRITGPLWQDSPHADGGVATPGASPWAFFDGRLGAWFEIHPVDWLEPASAPPVRKMPFVIAPVTYLATPGEVSATVAPDDPAPGPDWTLRCAEIVDGRYTDLQSVTLKRVTLQPDRLEIDVKVERRIGTGPPPDPGNPQLNPIIPGRFKAVYLVWWAQGPAATGCEEQ